MVSVGTTHCSWYFRGLILGLGFSNLGQRPHSVSLHRKKYIGIVAFISDEVPKLLMKQFCFGLVFFFY